MINLYYGVVRYHKGEVQVTLGMTVDIENEDEVKKLHWLHKQPDTTIIPPLNDDGTINEFGAKVLLRPRK